MLNSIALRAQEKLRERFRMCFESEAAEEFLQILLTLMQVTFLLNHEYRRNITNFAGRYQFKSADGQVTMAAVFRNGRMKVLEKAIENPNISITFRDGRTLLNFIISPRQDILGSMLRHDVRTNGNLNYLNKFGYMAKQLQLMMAPL